MILNLVMDYDDNEKSSCHHHVRNMLEYLIENYNYKKINEDIITANLNNLLEYFKTNYGDCTEINLIAFGGLGFFVDKIDILSKVANVSFIIDDIHHGKSINRYRQKVVKGCKYLFLHYAYHYERYFQRHNGLVFLPHATAYKIDFNPNPINKLLVSGHITKDIYPNRYLIAELSKLDDRVVVFSPDYCGYRISEKDKNKTFGFKYYQLLNQYLCCFADDSVPERRYILAKFFEIMGSGSLLIAFNKNTKTAFDQLGYIDKIHYFAIDETNYIDTINYVLDPDNLELVNKIRRAGMEFTEKYHHYTNRADFIDKILNGKVEIEYDYDTATNTKYIKYKN